MFYMKKYLKSGPYCSRGCQNYAYHLVVVFPNRLQIHFCDAIFTAACSIRQELLVGMTILLKMKQFFMPEFCRSLVMRKCRFLFLFLFFWRNFVLLLLGHYYGH